MAQDNKQAKQQKPQGNRPGNKTANSTKIERQQPKKDSKVKRVNYDNARVSRVEKDIKQDAKRYNANDASEYSRNPHLVQAAGNLPFAAIAGAPVYSKPVPGIMQLGWVPNFGPGVTPIALNQAGDSYYSFVTHANSRNTSYTAPDLMILTLAGAQPFLMLASMMRAYGSVKYYTEENLYVPDSVVRAQGFDPIDLRQNLATAWFDINNLINQMRQIWIPNLFPIVEHWYRLNSHIYTDAPGKRAQIYIPVQGRYFRYSETDVKTGSALMQIGTTSFDGQIAGNNLEFRPDQYTYKWSQWVETCQHMIDALINSEDRGVIYGDILKAYGAEKLYGLSPIDVNYTVEPDYNAEFLMQIENTNFADSQYGPIGLFQNEEDIFPMRYPQSFVYSNNWMRPGVNPVMNMHIDTTPSPEMIMVASRNMISGILLAKSIPNLQYNSSTKVYDVTTVSSGYMIDCAGSEIFCTCRIWENWSPLGGQVINMMQLGITQAMPLMAFDWHPFAYILETSQLPGPDDVSYITGTSYGTVSMAYGDYDNYTTVSTDNLRRLHDVAMYSLFGVPMV